MPRQPRHARRGDSARARDVAHRHGARALPQSQARVFWAPVPESIQGRSERGRRPPPQRDPKCARKSTRGWNPSRNSRRIRGLATRFSSARARLICSTSRRRSEPSLARPTRHAPHFATSCGTGRPRRATRWTVHPRPFTFRSWRPKPAVCHASSAPPSQLTGGSRRREVCCARCNRASRLRRSSTPCSRGRPSPRGHAHRRAARGEPREAGGMRRGCPQKSPRSMSVPALSSVLAP